VWLRLRRLCLGCAVHFPSLVVDISFSFGYPSVAFDLGDVHFTACEGRKEDKARVKMRRA
jgi:hypothetical protein